MDCDPIFPHAVDVPIPQFGNNDRVLLILAAAQGCACGAMVTTHGEPETAEVRQWFNRISTRTAEEADRLAARLSRYDARRVR